MKIMKCDMQCGACKREAAFVAETGGKLMDAISFGGDLKIVKVRAKRKTIHACNHPRHVAALERCVEMYGSRGGVRKIG